MANDTSRPVRSAIIGFLKDNGAVAARVGARIYQSVPNEPAWPYVRYGVDDAGPRLATGLDGLEIAIMLHGFAAGVTDDGCRDLCADLSGQLDGKVLPLPDAAVPAKLILRWTRTQVLRDIDKSDGWHGMVQFAGTVVS